MSSNRNKVTTGDMERIVRELVGWKKQTYEDNLGEMTDVLFDVFARIDAIEQGRADNETLIETMTFVRNSLILDAHLNRVLSKRDGQSIRTIHAAQYQKYLDTTAEFLTLMIDALL